MRRSIRVRLTVAFMGLAIAPLLLVGGVLAWRSYSVQQRQALHLQREVTQRVATEVRAFFAGLENELRVLSMVQGLSRLDRDMQDSVLSELLLYQGVFQELTLLDSQGHERIHVSRSILPPSILWDHSKADEFVLPHTSREVYYSPVRFEETRGEPLITIAIPLLDARTGLGDGVLVSVARMKTIWELIADIQVSPGQSVYIVDAQGKVVAHRNPSVVLRGTHFNVPNQEGVQPGLTGASVVLAVRTVHLGRQVLTILVEQARSEALALAISAVRIILSLIMAMLVISGMLGFLSVRQIVRPIQTMAMAAQAISAGDLSQQVQITRHDELGVLAEVFNSMITQLRGFITDLEQHVTERTASLQTANTQLRREIVERQRTELALQRAKDLAEMASRAKAEFLANMSHELRTPLHGILSFASFGLKMAAIVPPEKLHGYFQQIAQSGQTLLALVNDLLDLAKLEAGMMTFAFQGADLSRLLAHVAEEFSSLMAERHLTLRLLPSDGTTDLLLDSEKIMQVFRNLLSNAVKFSPAGGTIKLSMHYGERTVVVGVSDQGIGIPQEELTTIFERFVQSSKTKTGAGGTGLGLSICREIMTAHKGRIWAENRPEGGAVFCVEFPREMQDESDAAPAGVAAAEPPEVGPSQ